MARRVRASTRDTASDCPDICSPPTSWRQRRLQTVLEIPQREHLEEVQRPAASWFPRQQKARNCSSDPPSIATSSARERQCQSGSRGRQTISRIRNRRSCARQVGPCGFRVSRSLRRLDPVRRPLLVPGCKHEQPRSTKTLLTDSSTTRLTSTSPTLHSAKKSENG